MNKVAEIVRKRFTLNLIVLAWLSTSFVATADDNPDDFFEQRVRPLLINACLKCHGQDEQSGGLRLDSLAAALKGGEHGPAIVSGDVSKSLLVSAIRRGGDLKMPPEEPLSASQIDSLVRWIELGTPWPSGDAMHSPTTAPHWAFQRVADPKVPEIQHDGWVQTPIDAFVLSQLNKNELTPAPKADRRTLIRRATFDLTGLPPTDDEVDNFVADESSDAWPRLIDRLLDSPHYGEKWARHWLDVARYSDSKGYVYAREERFWVHAWVYRDWVVKALNDDLPYDRFLLLQIAADQLDADKTDLAALGFLTLGRRFLGVSHDIIDDRIDVLTRGTMGLTVACARCHDHKYDPIPTADYYSLYGVFRNCVERLVPLAEIADKQSDFAKGLDERVQKLNATMVKHRETAAGRVRARLADYLLAQLNLDQYPDDGFDQIYLESDIIPNFVRRWRDFLDHQAKAHDPVFEPWRRFSAIDATEFSEQAPNVCAELKTLSPQAVHPRVAEMFVAPPLDMQDVAKRYADLFAQVDRQRQGDKAAVADDDPLLTVLYGLDSPCEVPAEPIVNTERYFTSAETEELWKLRGEVDRWLINSPQSPPHALILEDKRAAATTDAHVLLRGNPKLLGDVVPRRFLKLFGVANRKPFQQGSGRLELARAIASESNPLTARVAVNRVWMHHFGAGLVRTASDFGRRADPPSHPELLDFLAARFVAGGWRIKDLHRMIMLSSTYQQDSLGHTRTRQLAIKIDPENRLLWKMSARRLTFEELRDAALAASGELNVTVGGKAVDLIASNRRTLYAQVDRQFFSSLMRVFDVATPDLHIAKRAETTVPQQALFFLNHPFLIARAGALAQRTVADDDPQRLRNMYRAVYQREPTAEQIAGALDLIQSAQREQIDVQRLRAEWKYGYGEYNAADQRLVGFTPLPYFNGKAWQGGPNWPDAALGWVQLHAGGGHPGNVKQHAAVRRWIAPRDMVVKIQSELIHEAKPGDGVRAYLVTNRQGLLKTADIHVGRERFDVDSLSVQAGETVDFVVDIREILNSDQYDWTVSISAQSSAEPKTWNSQLDFGGTPTTRLTPWELVAQALLSSNEFVFID